MKRLFEDDHDNTLPNLVLTGFMGVGKSAVGRAIAACSDLRFRDLDSDIVHDAGCSIAEIFTREGEAGFRRRERIAVERVAAGRGRVIAVGGGTVLDPRNLSMLAAGGLLVCLRASAEEIIRRLGDDASRPLLSGADRISRVQELLAAREPCYAAISCRVDTEGREVSAVAHEVLECYRRWLRESQRCEGTESTPMRKR